MKDHRLKSYDPDQLLLLPPDLWDSLPENHLAWFVSEVVDQLDLMGVIEEYYHLKGERPGFQPVMIVKLLLYAYFVGVPSFRQIEKKTYEDVAFRVLAVGCHPDHSAIAKFRKRHLDDLRVAFVEVLILAEEMGLVKLGHLALDVTKLKANASRHEAMSYSRMDQRMLEFKAEMDELMAKGQATEEAEDKRGDELPKDLRFKQSRIEKIRAAKAEIERRTSREAAWERNDDDTGPSGAASLWTFPR